MATTDIKVGVKVEPTVSWGKTSWIALLAAVSQAIVAFLMWLLAPQDQKIAAIGPLVGALTALYKLLDGRFAQATASLTNNLPPRPLVVNPVKADSQVLSEALAGKTVTATDEFADPEPGDHTDALPQHDTTPSDEVPQDQGDAGHEGVS